MIEAAVKDNRSSKNRKEEEGRKHNDKMIKKKRVLHQGAKDLNATLVRVTAIFKHNTQIVWWVFPTDSPLKKKSILRSNPLF